MSHFNLAITYTVPRTTTDAQIQRDTAVGESYALTSPFLTVVRSDDPYFQGPTIRIDFDYQVDIIGTNRSTVGDMDFTVPVPNIELGMLLWYRKLALAFQKAARDQSILAYDVEYGEVTPPAGVDRLAFVNTARSHFYDVFPTFDNFDN